MSQSDLIAFLDKSEAADLDAEKWIAALYVKESAQEEECITRLDAFYDEICSMVTG